MRSTYGTPKKARMLTAMSVGTANRIRIERMRELA
jgi:hypothetical protein